LVPRETYLITMEYNIYMSQIEKVKSGEIKSLLIKGYFESTISWDRVLKLLYDNSDFLQIINPLWIKIKQRQIFSDMPEVKDFLLKLNFDFGIEYNENCSFNQDWEYGQCHCEHMWHTDGFVVSLSPKTMVAHQDVHNTCYLQLIGNSFWSLDGKDPIKMDPGDVLFVSKDITHEVSGNGPRSGILFVERYIPLEFREGYTPPPPVKNY
jgi:hypothetical protein